MKKLNPFSLENIESKAEKKFRYRTFKEEYKDHRFSAMVFKLLFSAISIYFATYYFYFFFFRPLVPNQEVDSTIGTNSLTNGTIWLVSCILPLCIEVVKHLSVPIVINSIIRGKWVKTVVPLMFSILSISASYFFTIEGSAYIFNNEPMEISKIEDSFKVREDSIRDHYDGVISNEKSLLKELQNNINNKSLINSTISRIDKLEDEYTSTRNRMERILANTLNRDSVTAYYTPLLERIEQKIKIEQNRSNGLLSSNEKITLNTIGQIENLQNELDEKLSALASAKTVAINDLRVENNLLLEYIYFIAIGIETLILICIIFISYYDYRIVKGKVEEHSIKELKRKNELLAKELDHTKLLFEEAITKDTTNRMVPSINEANGTVVFKNGTAKNGTDLKVNGTEVRKEKKAINQKVRRANSSKEKKIEFLLREGHTYAQIAEKLGVSRRDISMVKKRIG